MSIEQSKRLLGLPPYPFVALRQKINELKTRGVDVISLAIGDPDKATPTCVVDEMIRAASDTADPDRFRYGDDQPVGAFTEAVQSLYREHHGVNLRSDQILRTSGSKEAIIQIAAAFMGPGDMGIVPDPGYPTYRIAQRLAGARTYTMPLDRGRWLPDLEAIPGQVREETKLMWLNYPNNPTTQVADLDFFHQVIEFAAKYGIVVIHDAAYNLLYFGDQKQPSIMEVPGASEVAVELISHSKPFNMTGWRIGAAVGNPDILAGLKVYKGNTDNGTPRFIQFAGVKALEQYAAISRQVCEEYERRRDIVTRALQTCTWDVTTPQATPYVWAGIPQEFTTSVQFCEFLVERAYVVVSPGVAFGKNGEGYVRFSLTYPTEKIAQAMTRIINALSEG